MSSNSLAVQDDMKKEVFFFWSKYQFVVFLQVHIKTQKNKYPFSIRLKFAIFTHLNLNTKYCNVMYNLLQKYILYY